MKLKLPDYMIERIKSNHELWAMVVTPALSKLMEVILENNDKFLTNDAETIGALKVIKYLLDAPTFPFSDQVWDNEEVTEEEKKGVMYRAFSAFRGAR